MRNQRNVRSLPSGVRQEAHTAAGADRAHLADGRVVSLVGGCIGESSCKELFQPQVVIQDHLEQGALTGWQLIKQSVHSWNI